MRITTYAIGPTNRVDSNSTSFGLTRETFNLPIESDLIRWGGFPSIRVDLTLGHVTHPKGQKLTEEVFHMWDESRSAWDHHP
jgi:hypothetical protein